MIEEPIGARGSRKAQEANPSSKGRLAYENLPTPYMTVERIREILVDQAEHTPYEHGQTLYEGIKMTHPLTAAALVDASYEYEDIAAITLGQGVELASGFSESESVCDFDSLPEQSRTWCRLTPYFYKREECLHQEHGSEPRMYRRIMEPEFQRSPGGEPGGDLIWQPSYEPTEEGGLFSSPPQPRFGEAREAVPNRPVQVGIPPIPSNARGDEIWGRVFGHKTRIAYFKKVYAMFQEKDLEPDPFMLADALDVFGKTAASKTIGYALDILIDLVQAGKPYLRQAERQARKTACCAACKEPLFRSGPEFCKFMENPRDRVIICEVCNEWIHLGDPSTGTAVLWTTWPLT